jgi:hypothetical protein
MLYETEKIQTSVGLVDEQDIVKENIKGLEIIESVEIPVTTIITNMIPIASLEDKMPERIQEEKPTKLLVVNNTLNEVNLTFETTAPYTTELDQSTEGTFNKKVTVAHDSTLHYENVKSYSDIPEDLVSHGVEFKLFWMINGTKTDVTHDSRFQVEYIDTDENGIADQMQWIVPQLSEQEFEIEADIVIINVQSYPTVGGNWTVNFTTVGIADLTITGINGTTFGEAAPDDLKFLELNNGTHTLLPVIQGNSIIYYNYSSTQQGFEASKVFTPGKHHLEFKFGNDIAYANNEATASTITVVGSVSTDTDLHTTTTPTFSHTVPSGNDRLLVVAVTTRAEDTGGIPDVTGVTYDSVAMTEAIDATDDGESNLHIFTLIAPNEGTANVVVTVSEVGQVVSTATSFTGVDQTQTFTGNAVQATGTSTAPSVQINQANSESVIFSAVVIEDFNGGGIGTADTGSERWDVGVDDDVDDLHGIGATEETTDDVTLTTGFTLGSSAHWIIADIEIKGGVLSDSDSPSVTDSATLTLTPSSTPDITDSVTMMTNLSSSSTPDVTDSVTGIARQSTS